MQLCAHGKMVERDSLLDRRLHQNLDFDAYKSHSWRHWSQPCWITVGLVFSKVINDSMNTEADPLWATTTLEQVIQQPKLQAFALGVPPGQQIRKLQSTSRIQILVQNAMTIYEWQTWAKQVLLNP